MEKNEPPGGMFSEGAHMTEVHRAMAELTAQTVVARILDKAKDRDTAREVIETWSDELDRTIGRAVRRALLWLASAVAIALAIKMGALEKLSGWMK